MAHLVLATGGSRSGKSEFAERYLAACPGRHAYIATARALDAEMKARIDRHQARRPAAWQTFEVPSGLLGQLDHILAHADALLIDCLTLYVSNFLLQRTAQPFADSIAEAEHEWALVLRTLRQSGEKTIVIVPDEVGSGIVPMEPLSRQYRDLLGLLNQQTAAAADEVYVSICGITTEIKAKSVHLPPVEDHS